MDLRNHTRILNLSGAALLSVTFGFILSGCLSSGTVSPTTLSAITNCSPGSTICPSAPPASSRNFTSTTTAIGVTTDRILGSTTAPYGFVEYLPGDYNTSTSRQWPLIIMLHGLGEEGPGTSNAEVERAAVHGPNRRIREGRHFPAVILTPQSPVWWDPANVNKLIDYALSHYRIDSGRVYVTGLSMGGGGTWDIGGHSLASTKIAAIVPIAGAAYANSTGAANMTSNHISVWAFHNQDDPTVTIQNSDSWLNAFGGILGSGNSVRADNPTGGPTKTAHFRTSDRRWEWRDGVNETGVTTGATYSTDYHYTVNPTGGHDSWTAAYANEALWTWLFKQTRD